MAQRSGPMIFGKARVTDDRFDEWGRRIDLASKAALDRAGVAGAKVARSNMTRVRTGESKRKIGWNRPPGTDTGVIYVGTLQGSIQNYGTTRAEKGTIQPLRFLQTGMTAGLRLVWPETRRLM